MSFSQTLRKHAGTIIAGTILSVAPSLTQATPPTYGNSALSRRPTPAYEITYPLADLASDARFMGLDGTLEDLLETKAAALQFTNKPDSLATYLDGGVTLLPVIVSKDHGADPNWTVFLRTMAATKNLLYVCDSGKPSFWKSADDYVNHKIDEAAFFSQTGYHVQLFPIIDSLRAAAGSGLG